MHESNFFLSALQPENGVCSLALPSDQQLDRKNKETQDTEVLKNARVQEQVRMRMLQKSHSAPRTNGAGPDYELKGKWLVGLKNYPGPQRLSKINQKLMQKQKEV
uniref:Plakophilin-3 n=1 Tax=Sphaerodactylus townsendi TaxID=933632 RepID=A0ACB8G289_9SAUR